MFRFKFIYRNFSYIILSLKVEINLKANICVRLKDQNSIVLILF